MGIGQWKGRQDWPLEWLKLVNVMTFLDFKLFFIQANIEVVLGGLFDRIQKDNNVLEI
jgi:hypothetical protein